MGPSYALLFCRPTQRKVYVTIEDASEDRLERAQAVVQRTASELTLTLGGQLLHPVPQA